MNKTAIAAAALAGATALTGASVSSSAAPSTEAKAAHVFKWSVRPLAEHQTGDNSFTQSEVVRSRRTHKIVGYDALRGRFYPAKDMVKIHVAFALKGGIIVARGHLDFNVTDAFHGTVVSGTGKFKGITGTMTARDQANDSTFVTLRVNY
jgi:hypothetical protein